jgi:hypothetical protein
LGVFKSLALCDAYNDVLRTREELGMLHAESGAAWRYWQTHLGQLQQIQEQLQAVSELEARRAAAAEAGEPTCSEEEAAAERSLALDPVVQVSLPLQISAPRRGALQLLHSIGSTAASPAF